MTQNIDGLHWRAGSREIIELHGNINRKRCFDCGEYARSWDEDGEIPPPCALCGGMLRPDVIWMGEGLPQHLLRLAYHAAEQAHVFFSIGASADVAPAAALPLIAKRAGAHVIAISDEEHTQTLLADIWLRGRVNDILPALTEQIMQRGSSIL